LGGSCASSHLWLRCRLTHVHVLTKVITIIGSSGYTMSSTDYSKHHTLHFRRRDAELCPLGSTSWYVRQSDLADNLSDSGNLFYFIFIFLGECSSLLVRINESRVVHSRAKRSPGDHRQDGKYLARFRVPVCDMPCAVSGHLVDCGRSQRSKGCGALGCRAA